MHDGQYATVQQRLLGLAQVAVEDRLEVTRMLESAREAGGVGAGQLDDQRDRHVFGIQRDAVAEDEQKHHRQEEGDCKAARVAQDLVKLFTEQSAQPGVAAATAGGCREGVLRVALRVHKVSKCAAARSVWSAWSLLPLLDAWHRSKAPASWSHSKRFAQFGCGSAAFRNLFIAGASYPGSAEGPCLRSGQ